MVKDVGGYNRKFIVKLRPLSSAKAINMGDYTIPTKRDFNPDLYILHAGTKVTSNGIIDTAKSLVTEKNKIIISKIVPKGKKYKEKVAIH